MPTNLLDLPLELRNHVYHELWKHTPRLNVVETSKYGSVFAKRTHDDIIISNRNAVSLPQWLFACKKILSEALEEFKLKGEWIIWFNCYDTARKPSIFSPIEARYLHVNFAFLVACYERSKPRQIIITRSGTLQPEPRDRIKFTGLISDIAASHAVQELTIHFNAHIDFDHVCLCVDLSGLNMDALEGTAIEKLTFEIGLCCYDDLGGDLITSLTDFVKRIGEKTLGKGALLSVEMRPREVRCGVSYLCLTLTRG
jgi:hypothetical protein